MLKRKQGLKRTGALKRTRIRPVSAKRALDAHRRKKVREAVFARDGRCLLNPYGPLNPHGQDWGPCFGKPLTFHHLRKASGGGEYTEANGVTLCSGHNDMVEDYPISAAVIGLVVRVNSMGIDEAKVARELILDENDCPHDAGVYRDGMLARCKECDEVAPWSRRRR